jgi:hypothetical protein
VRNKRPHGEYANAISPLPSACARLPKITTKGIGLCAAHVNRRLQARTIEGVHALAKGESSEGLWWLGEGRDHFASDDRLRSLSFEVEQAAQPLHASLPAPAIFFSAAAEKDGVVSASGPLSMKRGRMRRLLASYHGSPGVFCRFLVKANRTAIFDSSCEAIASATSHQILSGMHVQFQGPMGVEPGLDFGGLRAEWFDRVCSQIAMGGAMSMGMPSMRRLSSVKGTGEPMLRPMQDGCFNLEPSNRPPIHYFVLGKVLAMSVVYTCQLEDDNSSACASSASAGTRNTTHVSAQLRRTAAEVPGLDAVARIRRAIH